MAGLLVDELKEDTEEDRSSNKGDTQILNYPTNYETCFSFLYLLKNAAKVISALSLFHILSVCFITHFIYTRPSYIFRYYVTAIGTKDSKTGTDDDNDEENLQGSSNTKCGKNHHFSLIGKNHDVNAFIRHSMFCTVQEGAKKEKKLHRFPPNWEVLIRFLIIMMKAILILFGVGKYIHVHHHI